MKLSSIYHIAQQELLVTVRNKWTIIFAFVFGVLVVSISYFGIMAEGFSGMQNFTRTSASILNLVLYIVPLVALIMGTLSFAGDRGMTELLFSQPISRFEVVLGKLIGLFISIALSMLMGFIASAVVISFSNGTEGLLSYSFFVLLTLTLAFIFLSLAAVVATSNHRKGKAFGVSLFLWFFFVLFYDLLTIGGSLLLKGQSVNTFLFLSLFGNPVDIVRVASLIALDNVTIFGAAGAALLRFLGGEAMSVLVLVVALLGWLVLPIVIAGRLMRKQDF